MEQHLYLAHHGIKGQKWGIRRFRNEDGTLTEAGKKRYSSEQFKRDEAIYGRSGAKRIQKQVEVKGESVSGARSGEARRIASARRRATIFGVAGSSIGKAVGGVVGIGAGYTASGIVLHLLGTKGNTSLDSTQVTMATTAAISVGTATVASMLGRDGGRAIGMLTAGYSPEKYRYE